MAITKTIAFIEKYRPQLKVGLDLIADKLPSLYVVDFYSPSIDDLMLVAKHRVTYRPTILFMNNNAVVGRLLHIPDDNVIVDYLQRLV